MARNKPISTRWAPEFPPPWTIGLHTEEVSLVRAAMRLVLDTTSNLMHQAAAAGILKELEEAGERRLEQYYQENEKTPTPEDLRALRDMEF